MAAAAAAAAKKLVVCGGNGFLGSRICKFGVLQGWEVTSISRSGEPRWDTVSESRAAPSWARRVAWERADIFRPETYAPLFRGAHYAVHSLGILLEADYKGILSGRDAPLAGLRKVATTSAPAGAPKQQLTYEAMNRDSAVLAARAAADAGVESFAYISAQAAAPGVPAGYLRTKREAEAALARMDNLHRPLFVRAPFMYDAAARPLTLPLAAVAGAGALVNRFTGGALGSLLGSVGNKPMKVDEVAEAVVEALSDPTVEGAVDLPQLNQLADRAADRAWRKGML